MKPLTGRIKEAKAVARLGLCQVVTRYPNGRAKLVSMPGHDGHRYSVLLRYDAMDGISGEGMIDTGRPGLLPCPAAEHRMLCWHIATAVEVAFREDGFELRWFDNPKSATRSKQRGGLWAGRVYPERWKVGQVLYAVARKLEAKR